MITESRESFAGTGTRALSVGSGAGRQVILLHGYADTADTWRDVLRGLATEGVRAMALDLPGFGKADSRPSGALVPQFDAFADAVLAKVGPAVLVGNSLGSATAVRAASRHPAVVKGLLAMDDPLNASHWLARLARRNEIPAGVWRGIGHIRAPAATRWATRVVAPRFLYGPDADVDPEVVARWTDTLSRPSALAVLCRYAFQYAHETSDGHAGVRVKCPTVVMHGARDRIIPVQASRTLHRQIPGSDFVVLARSGHCPQLDNPAEVVRQIVRLLGKAS